MAPHLVFYLLKALSNLSLKVRILARLSYRHFPAIFTIAIASALSESHSFQTNILFIITKNCRVSSAHVWMTSSQESRIANEGDWQGADNKFQIFEIHQKNALNEAMVEKSPCI